MTKFKQWAEAEAAQGIQRPPCGRCSTWFHPGANVSFALHVRGNSMIPTVYDGEVVFIDPQQSFHDGQMLVVEIDGGRTLKRVYHVPDGLRLVPDNKLYDPVTLPVDAVKIVGIVVARGCQ